MTNGDAQERTAVMEVSQVEMREEIIRLHGRINVIDAKMDAIDKRMDDFHKRIDDFHQRMDRFEARMDRLEAKMDRLLYFMVGLTVINVCTVAAGFWAVTAAIANN